MMSNRCNRKANGKANTEREDDNDDEEETHHFAQNISLIIMSLLIRKKIVLNRLLIECSEQNI